jgi:Flp pilus assembly protein TadD
MLCRARFLFCCSLAFATAAGQQLLIPGGETGRPQVQFQTQGNPSPALSRPALIRAEPVVWIDASWLASSPANSPALSKLLLGTKGSSKLVALTPAGETVSAGARTRAELSAGLRTIGAAIASDQPPVTLDAMLAFLASAGSKDEGWTQVLYLGPQPAIPAELREYGYALVGRRLAESRIRFLHCNADAARDAEWTGLLRAAGGGSYPDLSGISLEIPFGQFAEVAVPALGPPEGFDILSLEFRLDAGELRRLPWIGTTATKPLPAVAEYGMFLELRSRLRAGGVSAPDLAALLAVNPADRESLRMAVDFADRSGEPAQAASFAKRILNLEPENGPYWSRLAYFHWQAGDTEAAESGFLRARTLQADHPQSAAILAGIRAGKKDFSGAVEHYREALRREPERLDLRLAISEAYRSLDRKTDLALALEEVLKRKPDLWAGRTELIDWYLQAGDGAAVRSHVEAALPLLPDNAALLAAFAGYCERLERPRDALRLWSRVVELDGASEIAHYSLARLQRDGGDWNASLAAAEAGTRAVPASARLIAIEVDALSATGRIDRAREVLREACARLADAELFQRAADFEDRYGASAPKYYRGLVEALQRNGEPEAKWKPAAERGLRASIRSASELCGWFAKVLNTDRCGPAPASKEAPSVPAPGGVAAVLFAARGPERSSPEAFLADYSRTLTQYLKIKSAASEAYRDRLQEYFGLLADLVRMGRREGQKTIVRLSLEDRNTARATERVLSLIGWRTRREAGKIVVEPAIKGGRARRQDLASALAIDLAEMQDRLQAGAEFLLEISDEAVPVFPAEKMWQDQFFPGQRYNGGLLEAMTRHPQMAELYSALANMERGSAEVLVQSIGMKTLAENYAPLLSLYSSSLQLSGGRVEVPGGDAAAPIWASLTKVQPSNPGRFLRALIDKDDGRLLRFYFQLSQLDTRRQRFFTASQRRTVAFYEAFRDSDQVGSRRTRVFGSASIEDLFRELPIDAEGRLEFPGGPEVWMVAKAKSDSVQTTERRLAKLSRVTTPEVEDEILLKLIDKDYGQNKVHYEAWQNLLAVLRVEEAQGEPLDENSALLLAEKFSSTQGLYGYFTELKGLKAAHYRAIFGFAEKVRTLNFEEANLAAGLFHSMLYLAAMAERNGRLDSSKVAGLVLDFATALNRAQTPGERTRAALQSLAAYLPAVGADPVPASLKDILITVTAGPGISLAGHTVNPGEAERRSYDRVLELQNVPRLDELLELHRALTRLSGGEDPGRSAASIVEAAKVLREPELPRTVKLPDYLKKMLEAGSPGRLLSLNKELQKKAAQKKPPKDISKMAAEYWEALGFRTLLALSGQAYAAHFRADDLLIAEDPLLLRKHVYVTPDSTDREFFPPGSLEIASSGLGSYGLGSLDGIASISGAAGAASMRNLSRGIAPVAAALLGSVRTTNWQAATPQLLRATVVQLHAAQDWLALAADDGRIMDAVAGSAYGLISLSRRARLLVGLRKHDWCAVWSSFSLTDLVSLAVRLRQSVPPDAAKTPAIEAFLEQRALPGADCLGPALPTLRRHMTPSLLELPPYEDAAAEMYPIYLAERAAEFKVYLARIFAIEGLPAEGLPAVAEAAARAVLGDIQMADPRDWPSVLDAFASFDAARLMEVLEAL